jgi:hypothetical protein
MVKVDGSLSMDKPDASPQDASGSEDLMPKEARKSGFFLVVVILVILMILLGMFVWIRMDNPLRQKTIDEVIDETLKGHVTENNFLYNNYAFVNAQNMWYTRWQKGGSLYTIPLRFNPRQVENVTIEGELDKGFDPARLYIAFDPRQETFKYVALAAGELSINLARALDANPVAACLVNETAACIGRPIVSCQDSDKAVILLREANETAVLLRGNCMILQGPEMDLLKSVDRVLYIWYGIMPRS